MGNIMLGQIFEAIGYLEDKFIGLIYGDSLLWNEVLESPAFYILAYQIIWSFCFVKGVEFEKIFIFERPQNLNLIL